VRGPNGFWRRYAGSLTPDAPHAEVTIMLHPDTGAESDHWFDFLVTLKNTPNFVRRFAGKIETGKPGHTDPGIGPMRMTI